MTHLLRIPRQLCLDMRTDLVRPHRFAAERVGFARVVPGTIRDGSLLLLQSYWPVPDEQYVDDPHVGARINGTAIRNAMQDVLNGASHHGLLHVHMHPKRGPTRLSRTDSAEIPKLVQSFRNVDARVPHGLLILTPDHACSLVLAPGTNEYAQMKITIVGFPMEVLE